MADKSEKPEKPQEKPQPERQTFCSRCGEPCGNAAVCATCAAR